MPLDDLTQLYDRRELFVRLRQEIARSNRTRIPFSLVMIDVDHFKDVNDNYGHLRGDRVLAEIGRIVTENCREMDIPCRYGGDEFIVIMPETDQNTVEKAGWRILEKLGSHIFWGDEQQPDLHITISAGTTTYQIDLITPEALLEKADGALYLAKREGRNRLCRDLEVVKKFKSPALNFKSFINRTEELHILKTKFNSVLGGNGSLFVVSGEAGIGKTRLIMELKRYSTPFRATFLSTKPFEFGVTPPYHIFFQIIKSYINELGRHRIQIFSSLPLAYKEELVKFIPDLVNTMHTREEPTRLSPEYEKMRLFDAIYKLLEVISKVSPLIILLDDMQWAREADLELLGYLARNTANVPVLLCSAYRIEEVGDQHPFNQFLRAMSREHRFEKIELNGMGYDDTRLLLNAILGVSVTEKIAELIYRETDGNPFYVEEIIKSFVEEGTIYWDTTGWVFKDINAITLPSSVEDLLSRRFEGVDPEARELLTQASAIGSEFNLVLLQKLTNKNEGYLLDLLDLGIKNFIINPELDDSYSFTNILLQRALYATLNPVKRRRLHLQVAQAIEILNAGKLSDVYESLARHYLLAEEWQLAFDYNHKAAENLKKLYANQDAISHYLVCLDLISNNKIVSPNAEIEIHKDLADIYFLIANYEEAINQFKIILCRDDLDVKLEAEILLSLGSVYQRKADYENAFACYEEGKELLNEQEHRLEIARLDANAMWIYMRRGEYKKVNAIADKTLEIFTSEKSDDDIANVYNAVGTMYYDRSEWDKAEVYYQLSLDYRNRTGDLYGVAQGLNNLGNIYHRKGDVNKALEYHGKALEIREKIGDRFGISSSYNNIALVYDYMGELEMCLEYHQKSMKISKSLNIERSVALTSSNIGYVMLKTGDFDKSAEYSLAALEIFKKIEEFSHIASFENNLASAYIGLRKFNEALAVLEESEEICLKYGFKNLIAENYHLLANVYLNMNKIEEATNYANTAIDVAKKIKDREAEAEAYIVLGKIYLTQNRLDEAIAEFDRCARLFKAIQNNFTLAKSYFFAGVTLKKKGDNEAADNYLSQAKLIFARLGAKRFLALIDSELVKRPTNNFKEIA